MTEEATWAQSIRELSLPRSTGQPLQKGTQAHSCRQGRTAGVASWVKTSGKGSRASRSSDQDSSCALLAFTVERSSCAQRDETDT